MHFAAAARLIAALSLAVAVPEAQVPGRRPARDRPIVGAIRWDAWFSGNDYERFLQPTQWRTRLPFYARVSPDGKVQVRSDSQEIMDREITYAHEAGLDYWAFCWYHPQAWEGADRMNYGLRRYLSSPRRSQLNFAVILLSTHVGTAEQWPQTVEYLVSLFREPTYQKVLASRPLVFAYELAEALPTLFGSEAAGRDALDLLRRKSVEVGLGSPYLVTQVWHAPAGAEHVRTYGFDAISAYSAAGWGEHREYPFSALERANRDFWSGCKATGNKVIPLVNAGWDPRPRLGDERHASIYGPTPWYVQPTPRELGAHLRSALDWVRENPAVADAESVLVYAWNETDEGGWLVPTLAEGASRLDAIRKVLR